MNSTVPLSQKQCNFIQNLDIKVTSYFEIVSILCSKQKNVVNRPRSDCWKSGIFALNIEQWFLCADVVYYEIFLLYSTVCRHKATIPEACNIAYDCNINTNRPLLIPRYRNSPKDRNRLKFAHLQLYNNWKFIIGWVGICQNTQNRQVWPFAFTGGENQCIKLQWTLTEKCNHYTF